MSKRQLSRSASICDGFRQLHFTRSGRGFLPLLAVILLVAPSLAFANGLTVTVDPRSLDIQEPASGNAIETYTIELDEVPTEVVKVTVLGAPHDEVQGESDVKVSSTEGVEAGGLLVITFSPDDADFEATVNVHAYHDADAVSERVTLTHTAVVGSRDEVPLANSSVTVRVIDPGTQMVTVSPTAVLVGEGAFVGEGAASPGEYTVGLTTRPTGTVIVDVENVKGEISVSPSRLVFTPQSWLTNPEQTVRVYAGVDADADNDTVTLTHTVSGGDYTNVSADPVTITVIDPNVRAINVVPGTLNVAAGKRGKFTIGLSTQPKGTVDIIVAKDTDPPTDDNDQVTVTPKRVSFSASNWGPKSVTVNVGSKAATPETGKNRNSPVNIDLTVDISKNSRDRNYVPSESNDDAPDSPGPVEVTVSATLPSVSITTAPSSLTVQERSIKVYTVRIGRPTADGRTIPVYLSSSDPLSVTVTPPQLDFEADGEDGAAGNWNTPQEVRVEALVDDDAVEEKVVVEHRWVLGGPIVKTVAVTVDELDTRGVTVSPTSLEVGEGDAASNTYTVALESDPVPGGGSVTVTISSSSDNVVVSPSQLTFISRGTAQEVTVRAIGDDDAEPNSTVTLKHTVRGADYSGVRASDVKVTIREENTRGISLSMETLSMMEGERTSYNVKLTSQPTGTVTIQVLSDSDDLVVRPAQLKFTTSDWSTDQTVRVRAEHDDDAEEDPVITLRHTASGGGYSSVSTTVRVTITEDDDVGTTGARVRPGALTIEEGGAEQLYTVVLLTQPTGTVRVQVSTVAPEEPPPLPSDYNLATVASRVRVKPTLLTFTQDSWNSPQTVRVSGPEDRIDYATQSLRLMHTMSGGRYDEVTAEVRLRIRDNDTASFVANPSRLEIVPGKHQEYMVSLGTEPTADVTVAVSFDDQCPPTSNPPGGVTATPEILTFNPSNWMSSKEVRVHATSDATVGMTNIVNCPSGADDNYSALSASVAVTVKDPDVADVAVSPTAFTITEGESKNYSVVLTRAPTHSVTVKISGYEGDISVSPRSLNFSTSNWNTSKTVKVTLAQDDDANDDRPVTLEHDVTSTDPAYDGKSIPVTVTPRDDDQEGVTITPTSLTIGAGSSGTYRVKLNTRPTDSVRVVVDEPPIDAVTAEGSPLIFTISNWSREQTITVKVDKDGGADEEQVITLTHTVSGGDYPGEGEVPSVTVRIPVEGVPSAPTGLSASAGDGRVTLRWSAPSRDGGSAITRYEYRYREDGGSYGGWTTVSGGASATSTTVTGLDNGTAYEFQVRARTDIGPGPESNTASATLAESVPGAPTGLTAESGDQSATLTWGPPADDGGTAIVRYELRYRETGGSYGSWRTVSGGASARSATVRNLDNGTSYEFQVRAFNGISPGHAATASATLAESAPGAPSGLTATGGDESVTLNWSAPGDGGSQILRYEYRYAASGETWSEWMTVSGGGNARSVAVSGLTNGTLYGFQVRAVNSVDEGEAAQATATPGRAPSAPTGLAASVESESITVMWGMPADDGGSAIVRYEVNYRESGGQASGWMTVAGGASATSHTIMGLTNGIGYEIAVRAVNGIDPGPATSVEATPMEGINFAHFANGESVTSDIVLVNVETSTVTPAIYFYNQKGEMIDADSVVDVMGDLAVAADGALTVPMGIVGRGEMTISTNGEGSLVIGSVRVFASGRMGGVLRFDIPTIGVAGVGASEPVSDAIFPARRMAGGINTGAAIRNLSADPMTVTCHLMQAGDVMDTAMVRLAGDGHSSEFINEVFPGSNTTDFVGSVRCTAPDGGMFAGVALELDTRNGIFTTLPVVPYDADAADDGISMLNFAHFANGVFGGVATSSELVFVNVANTAVAPAIYFYDREGGMIAADMVVDVMMDGVEVDEDGALMVMDEIPAMGEMTISTSGMGAGVVGSVRVVSDGPIGGVLRFDSPTIGVAGVGASEAVNAAIFPARRMAGGINTGAAIRNLESEAATVTCRLMADGQPMGEAVISLAGNGQSSKFINEIFSSANTDDFEGSVHCTAPEGSMFTGVALEMDFNNRIFTTLPMVPVQ